MTKAVYDAALLLGDFRNAAAALMIVAIFLLLLWVGTEFRLRAVLELLGWLALACVAAVFVCWIVIGVWFGLL
ncbi:hypothetical protein JQ633_12670 [Bradyrhizobium tropiciagri]|uniref:hypothetical protein n=1 Tax=Bradyrhizobium tropiciagri TaxID=312253 RepID=UPI001BA84226|nr:hypothetical protein [Bradyrhizobium tropiciagri]MBR0871217.1 hypothetical protein [Bradyrhizobium tropiciagri]